MTSHKKVHSQGNVPFLWEDTPGVSKGVVLPQTKTNPSGHFSNNPNISTQEGELMKIPPPPCPAHRTCSTKSLRQTDDDPFLVALKECTKSAGDVKAANETAVVDIMGIKVRKGKFNLSCKRGGSCEVQDGNLVKLPNLPRTRRVRSIRIAE